MIRVNSKPFSDGAKRELKIKTDYRSFAVLIRLHGIMKNFRHIKYVLKIFIAMGSTLKALTFLVSPTLF
jgi:hypothetical protein